MALAMDVTSQNHVVTFERPLQFSDMYRINNTNNLVKLKKGFKFIMSSVNFMS
jgi:hypothetical protein